MDNSFIYRNDRPWPNPRLKRAAIVGHTTDTSARIWFRTSSPGQYTLLLYPSQPEEIDVVFDGFKAVPYTALNDLPAYVRRIQILIENYDHDSTYVTDIEDLNPLTEYLFALHGEEDNKLRILLGQDRPYSFRTLPATQTSHSFAFYSCHLPYKHSIFGGTNVVNMEMWNILNSVAKRHYKDDFRLIIGGGDQVYTDGVKTLDIWKYLNKKMCKVDTELHPSADEMISWYRDIYRGYWGFPAVKEAFSSYPNYMIWDDHELKDGWGSDILSGSGKDDLDEIFPKRKQKKLSRHDCLELLSRMGSAAKRVYEEYQHSHNPDTPTDIYDFSISNDSYSIYFLDGRGYRDVNRRSRRVLGQSQLNRFIGWLDALDPAKTRYLFVVSAVPILHMTPVLVNADDNLAADLANLQDDLRDAWEHKLHDSERKALVNALFKAENRGIRVSVMSGDVHTSAVFRLTEKASGAVIYQLTSSAITYSKPRLLSWLLGNTVLDEGESSDGYSFERLALYTESNFSVVNIDTVSDSVFFQLYGQQSVAHPENEDEDRPMTHSIAKIKLYF